jgi:hypothetical protein
MSDSDHESPASAAALRNRRLRLRNARLSVAQLPFDPPTLDRRWTSAAISLHADGTAGLGSSEQDWESEEGEMQNSDEANIRSSRSHYKRTSITSILSSSSTLVGTPTPSINRRPSLSPKPYTWSYHRRSGSGDGRYVDYLERQVAELTSQLQSYTSPALSDTSHAAKMRKLSAENQELRNEIAEWETKFSVRVGEEVASRQEVDKSLRLAIAELEMMLEEAEHNVTIAQTEAKDLKERCDDLRGIEKENRSLEVRIEVLTGLLANSARVPQSGSPGSPQPSIAKTPRRASIQGSEAAMAGSTPTNRRISKESSSAGSHAGSFSDLEDYGITDPIEGVLFAMEHDARPSTASSQGSIASSRILFGTGLPLSPVPGSNLRNRRMRKFPPGSTAPKTLILPAAAAVISPGLPVLREPSYSPPNTRPMSAGSNMSRPSTVDFTHQRRFTMPPESLFAELSRVQSDSSSDDAPPGCATVASTAPTSPTDQPDRIESAVAESLSQPTPLVVKVLSGVGESLASPSSTFYTARRRAIDMVGRVVGRGVDRVAQRRSQVLTSRPSQRRRIFPDTHAVPTPRLWKQRGQCCECGAIRGVPMQHSLSASTAESESSASGTPTMLQVPSQKSRTIAELALKQQHNALEDGIWLWVRLIIAVVVALTVAVKDGPKAVVMGEDEDDGVGIDNVREEERELALRRLEGEEE